MPKQISRAQTPPPATEPVAIRQNHHYSIIERQIRDLDAGKYAEKLARIIRLLIDAEKSGISLDRDVFKNLSKAKIGNLTDRHLKLRLTGRQVVQELNNIGQLNWTEAVAIAANKGGFDADKYARRPGLNEEKVVQPVRAWHANGVLVVAESLKTENSPLVASIAKQVLGITLKPDSVLTWVFRRSRFKSWPLFLDFAGSEGNLFSAESIKAQSLARLKQRNQQMVKERPSSTEPKSLHTKPPAGLQQGIAKRKRERITWNREKVIRAVALIDKKFPLEGFGDLNRLSKDDLAPILRQIGEPPATGHAVYLGILKHLPGGLAEVLTEIRDTKTEGTIRFRWNQESLLIALKRIDERFDDINFARLKSLQADEIAFAFEGLNDRPIQGDSFLSIIYIHFEHGLDQALIAIGVDPNERRLIGSAKYFLLTAAMKAKIDSKRNAALAEKAEIEANRRAMLGDDVGYTADGREQTVAPEYDNQLRDQQLQAVLADFRHDLSDAEKPIFDSLIDFFGSASEFNIAAIVTQVKRNSGNTLSESEITASVASIMQRLRSEINFEDFF